ncbi:hypothetical protein IQ22_04230 [Pseudomonas duriflava]|uniref:Uncharacterized protein n=1 Tax=Pseudomonas duriflava TaxID=459528 RepID=A0A562PUB4_9PSED|nr:hypothetical protein [Pseudomonas duriflava]TWI48037.1 hypothetical protein IQ22_04230 [Pseudomonas duriflava]
MDKQSFTEAFAELRARLYRNGALLDEAKANQKRIEAKEKAA